MQTAMKLFIDNVPTLVTEVAIISPLPTLFQPKDVLAMTEQEVSAITAESKENKARRDELTSQLTVLKDGARTCKEYATYRSACALNLRFLLTIIANPLLKYMLSSRKRVSLTKRHQSTKIALNKLSRMAF